MTILRLNSVCILNWTKEKKECKFLKFVFEVLFFVVGNPVTIFHCVVKCLPNRIRLVGNPVTIFPCVVKCLPNRIRLVGNPVMLSVYLTG